MPQPVLYDDETGEKLPALDGWQHATFDRKEEREIVSKWWDQAEKDGLCCLEKWDEFVKSHTELCLSLGRESILTVTPRKNNGYVPCALPMDDRFRRENNEFFEVNDLPLTNFEKMEKKDKEPLTFSKHTLKY